MKTHKTHIIRILGLFIMLLSIVPNGFANESYSVKTIPNVRLDDRFNHVSNPDQIISPSCVDSINILLNTLEDSTGIQVAVVAINSIDNDDPRQFATDLFNAWGLGNEEEDDGLLILLITKPEQRSVVFETGYGVESILPDVLCYRIQQDHMLPAMKEGNYSLGMLNGVQVASQYLLKGEIYEKTSNNSYSWGEDLFWIIVFLIIGLFFLIGYLVICVIIPHMIAFVKRLFPKTCPECGKKALKYKEDKIMRKATTKANGWGYEIYICENCGHEEKEKFTLHKPKKHTGSSRYRSGSSTSYTSDDHDGGSWGGGSSGGGGSISRF